MAVHQLVGECRTYSETADTHDHPFAQLILPLQGTLLIETSVQQLELDDRRLFFLPPRCQHTFRSETRNQFLVFDIPRHLLIETSQTPIAPELDDRWQALRILLLLEIEPLNPSTVTPLIHYACQLLQPQQPRSIDYLHQHFAEPISLAQLAKLEGYSLTYYCEWFKIQTGQTPHAYLQSLRLQKAKTLLSESNLSVQQIAQLVGYEHGASLTRLFQQHERQTPIAYRQQSRSVKANSEMLP